MVAFQFAAPIAESFLTNTENSREPLHSYPDAGWHGIHREARRCANAEMRIL
jgi:hypothetical protein